MAGKSIAEMNLDATVGAYAKQARIGVDAITKGTLSEHDRNIKGTPREQDKRTPSEHHKNRKITQKEHKGNATVAVLEHDRNTISTPQKRNNIGTISVSLSKQHYKVYSWFTSRGYEGTFNKALIVKESGVAYMTVRKALWRLESTGIIDTSYDATLKEYEYTINRDIEVKGPKRNNIRTETEQYRNNIGTPSPLIEEEDNIINNLLLTLKDIFPLLSGLGLGQQQLKKIVKAWQADGLDLSRLRESLRRIEWALQNDDIKVDGNGQPIKDRLGYIFKSLLNGEYAKPAGYKSPAEIQSEAIVKEQRQVAALRQEASDLEFKNMLADPGGDLYKQCLERFNKFEKRDPADPKFKAIMRKYFNAIKTDQAG